MPRPRKRRPVDPQEVEAVISGEVEADLARVLDLVRRVNPSRLGRGAREQEERYELKARLQSWALRAFADEVVVVRTRRVGVVGIRRREGRGDACHAVVSRLDPEARAIVESALQRGTATRPNK